jgi:hypothetical protein
MDDMGMPRHSGSMVIASIGNIPELVVHRDPPPISMPYTGNTGMLDPGLGGAAGDLNRIAMATPNPLSWD